MTCLFNLALNTFYDLINVVVGKIFHSDQSNTERKGKTIVGFGGNSKLTPIVKTTKWDI